MYYLDSYIQGFATGMIQDAWEYVVNKLYKLVTALMDMLIAFVQLFIQQTSMFSYAQDALSALPDDVQWILCSVGFVQCFSVIVSGYLMKMCLKMLPIPYNPFR